MAHRPLSVPLVPGTYLPGYECSVISGSVKGGLSHRGVALSSGSGDAESPAVRQICRLSPSSLARAESPRQPAPPASIFPTPPHRGRQDQALPEGFAQAAAGTQLSATV